MSHSDANVAAAPEIQYVGNWPHLDHTQLAVIICANIGSFIAAVILLRVIWKAPTEKELASAAQTPQRRTSNTHARTDSSMHMQRCICATVQSGANGCA